MSATKIEPASLTSNPIPAPTQPKRPFKRSSTVLTRIIPMPGASGARPSSTSLRSKPKIDRKCERCQAVLDLESIVQSGQIIDGQLVCGRCIKKMAASRKLRAYFRATLAIMALTVLVVSAVLPQVMLLVLLPAGAIAVLAGILAFNCSGATRLGFAAAGLAAIIGSFVGTETMKERARARQVQESFQKQTDEVHAAIENNHYVEASNQIQFLESSNRDRNGQLPPAVQAKVEGLKKQLDAWVVSHYGELNTQEKSILSGLLTSFPEAGGASVPRFRAVKFQDNAVTIAATAQNESKADGPARGLLIDPLAGQARGLALLIFGNYPVVKRVEIELLDADSKSLGRFDYDREQATALRMGMAPPPGVKQ